MDFIHSSQSPVQNKLFILINFFLFLSHHPQFIFMSRFPKIGRIFNDHSQRTNEYQLSKCELSVQNAKSKIVEKKNINRSPQIKQNYLYHNNYNNFQKKVQNFLSAYKVQNNSINKNDQKNEDPLKNNSSFLKQFYHVDNIGSTKFIHSERMIKNPKFSRNNLQIPNIKTKVNQPVNLKKEATSPIYSKKLLEYYNLDSSETSNSDEESVVWDNDDLKIRGLDKLENADPTQQFIKLFQYRYETYIDKKQINNLLIFSREISHKEIIQQSKKLTQNYHISLKQLQLGRNSPHHHYTEDHNLQRDENFLSFNEHIQQKGLRSYRNQRNSKNKSENHQQVLDNSKCFLQLKSKVEIA